MGAALSTAPSICSGQPTGICDCSRSPALSDSSVNMQWPAYWHMWLFKESIAVLFNNCAKHWYIDRAFRLICTRLQFHVSGASRPRLASSASAGNSGCSLRQCFLFDYQFKAMHRFMLFLFGMRCRFFGVTMSSNQVGRTDLTPIALAEFVFLMLPLRRLWYMEESSMRGQTRWWTGRSMLPAGLWAWSRVWCIWPVHL